MSIVQKSINRSRENSHMFGKTHSPETVTKINIAKGRRFYLCLLLSVEGSLVNTFSSARKAAVSFNVTCNTI